MADELDPALDPVLEPALRSALRIEADGLPFTLRADTVRRVRTERNRARRVARFSWLAAAAVVVVGVAAVAALSAVRPPNQIASPSQTASAGLKGLSSYGALSALAHSTAELGRQEGEATTQDGQWQIGVPQGTRTVEVIVSCLGTSLDVGSAGQDFAATFTVGARCDGQPVDLRAVGGGALASDPSPSVIVQAGAGTAFRLIVVDEAGTSPQPYAPTPDPDGLATYDALTRELAYGGNLTAAMRGEHTTSDTGTEQRVWDLGPFDGLQGQIAVSCFGPGLTVGFGDGTRLLTSIGITCDPIVQMTSLPAADTGGPTPHLMVQAMPSVRWRVVAGVVAASTASPESSGSAGLPSNAELLAAAPVGAVLLTSDSAAAAQQDSGASIGGIANRTSLAVVMACSGDGGVDVSIANDLGAELPLGSVVPGGCDGTPVAYSWDGATRDLMGPTHINVAYSAATSWTAIVVDTSRVPQDPSASPLPAGELPDQAVLSQSAAALGGLLTVLGPNGASGTTSTVTVGDVRVSQAVQVLVACQGQVSIGIVSPTGAATEVGAPVCDGTIQSFVWRRSDGPADGSRVQFILTDGSVFVGAIVDATGAIAPTAHPTPAAACGAPDLAARVPPTATLYQNGKPLGAVEYYTTSWVNGSSDGVPMAPSTTIQATTGPLVLRIAGDVCATSWSVMYGTPESGSPGMTPAGLLAIQAPGAGTPNQENQIDLAGLPSGDWMVEVNLTFADGDGAGVALVHVP